MEEGSLDHSATLAWNMASVAQSWREMPWQPALPEDGAPLGKRSLGFLVEPEVELRSQSW